MLCTISFNCWGFVVINLFLSFCLIVNSLKCAGLCHPNLSISFCCTEKKYTLIYRNHISSFALAVNALHAVFSLVLSRFLLVHVTSSENRPIGGGGSLPATQQPPLTNTLTPHFYGAQLCHITSTSEQLDVIAAILQCCVQVLCSMLQTWCATRLKIHMKSNLINNFHCKTSTMNWCHVQDVVHLSPTGSWDKTQIRNIVMDGSKDGRMGGWMALDFGFKVLLWRNSGYFL